jgi:surfeit locus 1 family protein
LSAERKRWKEALIVTLEQRTRVVPIDLPPPASWPALTPANDEFRRVRATLDFFAAPPTRLYTGGSALRRDVTGPGYFVFAPARLPGGEIVVVDTGFSPEPQSQPITGKSEIVGYLRWPEKPGWFVGEHDSSGATWFVRDHLAMARVKSWGERIAPFYIDQEAPVPPGGVPRPGPITVQLRNDHLGYALTWFGLAAALALVTGFWARKEFSGRRV